MSLWWSTEGDPDRWPVVLLDDLDGRHELAGMTMTEVLAETLRGEGRLGLLDLDADEDDEDVVELAFGPPGASRPTSTAKAPRRRRPGARSPRAAGPTTRRALEGWYVTWAGERAEILAGGIAPQESFGETVVLFAERAVALREARRWTSTPRRTEPLRRLARRPR